MLFSYNSIVAVEMDIVRTFFFKSCDYECVNSVRWMSGSFDPTHHNFYGESLIQHWFNTAKVYKYHPLCTAKLCAPLTEYDDGVQISIVHK